MEESIHPELEQIMQDAEKNVIGKQHENILSDLTKIEKAMMEDKGDPDHLHEMYFLTMQSADQLEQAKTKSPHVKVLGEDIPEEERTGVLSVMLIGEGENIYDGLSNIPSIVEASENPSVLGVMIRTGVLMMTLAEGSAEPGPKQNAVTTMLVTNQALATIVRNLETDEMQYEVQSLEDQNWRTMPLSHALVTFFHAPNHFKHSNPDMWEDIVQRVKNNDVLPEWEEIVTIHGGMK